MKLALVSDNSTVQGKEAIEYLLASIELPRSNITVGYIASCPDPDRTYFSHAMNFYGSLGVRDGSYLDLEDGYNSKSVEQVCSKTIIHLSGGNTYRFLHWLKRRELDQQLRQLVMSGKPIVGVSAGAMLLTPSIVTAALCGDANEVMLSDISALRLVQFLFCAHSEKSSIEQESAAQIGAKNRCNVVMCNDSDALYIDNEQVKEFGMPVWVVGI